MEITDKRLISDIMQSALEHNLSHALCGHFIRIKTDHYKFSTLTCFRIAAKEIGV